MRFRTTAGDLREACATAELAVKTTGAIELSTSANRIVAVGGDGEIGIRRTCLGDVETNGAVVCGARPLIAYAGAIDPETVLDVSYEGSMLNVSGGGRVYRFAVIGQQYLQIEEPGEGAHIVSAGGISDLYAAVRHAIDPNSMLVKCVTGEGLLTMYATDMYRGVAASRETDHENSWSVLFPSNGLTLALRQHPHTVRIDPRGRIASFYAEHTTISVRLGASEFPAIETVLTNKGSVVWKLPVNETLRALKRLGSVAAGESLRCEINEEELCVQASSTAGTGVEYVAIDGEGSGVFNVNPQLLIDALEAVGGETAEAHYQDPRKALHISGTRNGTSVVCVVMPVVR